MSEWSTEQLKELFDRAISDRDKAAQKFEESVGARFAQVNEFRGALEDLGKDMATRRELEAAIATIKAETTTALASAKAVTDAHATQISELRSRIDVGPATLRTLQASEDQRYGAERRSQQISASFVAWAVIGATLLSVVVGVIVKLA